MVKIHIPIEGAHAKKRSTVSLPVEHVFLMVAITLFTGFFLGRGILLPKTDPRMQIGAAFESTQKTSGGESPLIKIENTTPAPATVPDNLPEKNISQKNSETSSPSPEPESLQSSEDLNLSITDSEIAITRLNEEAARVKNDSVALISDFNSNCGNWKDACAKTYAAALEINNNTYNELVQKITKLERELNKYRSEKTARL